MSADTFHGDDVDVEPRADEAGAWVYLTLPDGTVVEMTAQEAQELSVDLGVAHDEAERQYAELNVDPNPEADRFFDYEDI